MRDGAAHRAARAGRVVPDVGKRLRGEGKPGGEPRPAPELGLVTPAPTSISGPWSAISFSAPMPPTSITTAGATSRKFIIGMRESPPARSRASSPVSARAATAASTPSGRR